MYKSLTEMVQAALIHKNLDPRFIAIRTKFMGQKDITIDVVVRACNKYSAVPNTDGVRASRVSESKPLSEITTAEICVAQNKCVKI